MSVEDKKLRAPSIVLQQKHEETLSAPRFTFCKTNQKNERDPVPTLLCHFVSHNIFMERHRFEEINFFCLAGFLLFV